jgi:hypothetical protein
MSLLVKNYLQKHDESMKNMMTTKRNLNKRELNLH